jgi:hypothetical protein
MIADLSCDGGCEPVQRRPLNKDVLDDLVWHLEEGLLAKLLDTECHHEWSIILRGRGRRFWGT